MYLQEIHLARLQGHAFTRLTCAPLARGAAQSQAHKRTHTHKQAPLQIDLVLEKKSIYVCLNVLLLSIIASPLGCNAVCGVEVFIC